MTDRLRCLIVDDEPIARDYLSDYVQKMPQLELVGTCSQAETAYQMISDSCIDLVFLDIYMPGMTGIELLRSMTMPCKPEVILTTAYSDYALEGYELDIVDYLLKPIAFERFSQAVGKAERLLNLKRMSEVEISSPVAPTINEQRDFLFVKAGYKSLKVNFSEIVCVEGMKEYVVIHTKDKKYTKLDRMKNLENLLVGNGFLRIHKSYIVSINAIKAIYGNVVEVGERELPIGRNFKATIEKALGL